VCSSRVLTYSEAFPCRSAHHTSLEVRLLQTELECYKVHHTTVTTLRKSTKYSPLYLKSANKILVRKPEGMRQLGRLMRRWEYNIRMDLREIRWEGVGWIHLARDRYQWRALLNIVMNLRVL